MVLLQVRTGLNPVRFYALSFLVFVLFGPLLFVLAVGELLVSANGCVGVWDLGAGWSRGWLRPLHFRSSRSPAEFMRRVQAIWTPLVMIVGFVELQFDLHAGVSMTGGATSPISAVVSVRGRLQRQTLV